MATMPRHRTPGSLRPSCGASWSASQRTRSRTRLWLSTSIDMESKRRRLLKRGAAALLALNACALAAAHAQQYPSKPIRFIVPSAPGGGPDTVARLLAPLLSEQLTQQVIVDNRPGGAFVIGIQAVATADPDGYTIGYGSVGPLAISPALVRKLPYDPEKQLQAIAQVGM